MRSLKTVLGFVTLAAMTTLGACDQSKPALDKATELDAKADELYAEGAKDGSTADDYVRTTVFLASVLFLVGISGHFRVRSARYGLVAVGAGILIVAVALLIAAPKPPG